MSYFGRNIKKIRTAKNISQAAFAELFQLSRASIGAYEEGRAEARTDTIIEIADYFKLTLDQLLKKELSLNDIYHIGEKSNLVFKETREPNLSEEIPYISAHDHEEFVKKFRDKDFLAKMPLIRLPDLVKNSIAFEYPYGKNVNPFSRIQPGNVLIAHPVDARELANHAIEKWIVFICEDKFHFGKLQMPDAESMHIKKNEYTGTQRFPLQEVASIWLVYMIISEFTPVEWNIETRLQNIENQLRNLINSPK